MDMETHTKSCLNDPAVTKLDRILRTCDFLLSRCVRIHKIHTHLRLLSCRQPIVESNQNSTPRQNYKPLALKRRRLLMN